MAYTDDNKNRVITVERLDQFYTGLHSVFLTDSVAEGKYALKNGSHDVPFNVGRLTINNCVDAYYVEGSARNSDKLVLTFDENQVNIPLIDCTLATEDQVKAKADKKTIVGDNTISYQFCVQPHPQVFTGVYGQTSVPAAIGQVYYITRNTMSSFSIQNDGFYLVTGINVSSLGSNGATIKSVAYICPASPYVVYYNISTEKFYRFSVNAFVKISSGSGTTPVDPPADYETASSEDIAGIIDNYINND